MADQKKGFEWLAGSLEQKKQYRQYKSRVKELPASYRDAQESLARYLMYHGGHTKGGELLQMLEDLLALTEQAAADETPIRELVGDDPVVFAEEFLANYTDSQWINKEKARLKRSIDEASQRQDQEGTP